VALKYDPSLIVRFFGSAGEFTTSAESSEQMVWIDYAGAVLRYAIMLILDRDLVLISGDTSHPFGGDSMYEISIPCTEIVEGPDGYHPGQVCLSFYYGDPSLQSNRQMTIMKRPDGELKVWPSMPFPQDHPIYRRDGTPTEIA
jgi:hypothetical protein